MIEYLSPTMLNAQEARRCGHETRLVKRIIDKFGSEVFGIKELDFKIYSTNPRGDRAPDVVICSGRDKLGRPLNKHLVEIVEFNSWSRNEGLLKMLRRTKLNPYVDYGKNTILLIGVQVNIKQPAELFNQISEALNQLDQRIKQIPVFIYHERGSNIHLAQIYPKFSWIEPCT